MKIILKEDIEHLGQRGKVVNVKDGYARNFLIPKGLAMSYTTGAVKVLDQEKRKYELKQVKLKDEALTIAEKMKDLSFTIPKRVGENDALFGSVTTTDIADLLEKEGFIMDKRKILLPEPIKKVGTYDISIRLHKEVHPTVKVLVVKEE